MSTNDDSAFIMWSKNDKTHSNITRQFPNLDDQALTSHLQKKWLELSPSEHAYWRKERQTTFPDWILDNQIKRCGTHYKWQSGTTMVAKCKKDGHWYIVDELYRKDSVIEGDWPTENGREVDQYQIYIKVSWTDNGLSFRFNKIGQFRRV